MVRKETLGFSLFCWMDNVCDIQNTTIYGQIGVVEVRSGVVKVMLSNIDAGTDAGIDTPY